MLSDMFSFIEPIVEPMEDDLFRFIARVEDLIESPEQFKDYVSGDLSGNPYELYLSLQSLKSGGISFENFLAQAKAWAVN